MATLSTIRRFTEKYPDGFTQGGLRALRFNCETNGFKDAFVTIGRKVLIDEKRFFDIVAEQNKKV